MVIVVVLMTVKLQAEGRANSQCTHHQQGDSHKHLCPGGNSLHMHQILEPDCDQSQHDHTGGVPRPPGQTIP